MSLRVSNAPPRQRTSRLDDVLATGIARLSLHCADVGTNPSKPEEVTAETLSQDTPEEVTAERLNKDLDDLLGADAAGLLAEMPSHPSRSDADNGGSSGPTPTVRVKAKPLDHQTLKKIHDWFQANQKNRLHPVPSNEAFQDFRMGERETYQVGRIQNYLAQMRQKSYWLEGTRVGAQLRGEWRRGMSAAELEALKAQLKATWQAEAGQPADERYFNNQFNAFVKEMEGKGQKKRKKPAGAR